MSFGSNQILPGNPLYRGQGNGSFETADPRSAAKRGQSIPYDVNGAPTGASVADGDYGDVVVTGSGAFWAFDSSVVSAFARTILDDADAATVRGTLGLGTAATHADTDFQVADQQLSDLAALAYAGNALKVVRVNAAANGFELATAGASLADGDYGDITVSGAGTAMSIDAGTVTLAKQANVATGTIFYRKTAGAGAPEVQTLATLKTDLGLTGTNSGDQFTAVTSSRLLGRFTAGFGAAEEIALGTGLSVAGGTLAYTPQAAGSDRQIQFNNGGALDGSSALDVDANGNLRADYAGTVTTPGADQVTFAPQRLNASGGRVIPRWRSEDGITISLQTHIGRNSIVWAQALGGSAANPSLSGMTSLALIGTGTARTPAATNRLTRAKRVGAVSAAGAGSAAGYVSNSAGAHNHWTVGGAAGAGFLAAFRWGVSDAAAVAGAHMLIGFRNSIAVPTVTASPATLTNVIGVAQVSGSANLQIVYGGSAAQPAIDLGASFPAADTTALYELILYARPDDATKVCYRVENISTGAVASGVLTGVAGTALPANTTFIGPIMWRSNNATALAVGLDVVGYYIESDI